MSGSIGLRVHIWNTYLPLIFKQKSGVFSFWQILFPPICITVSVALLHSQYKQESSASPRMLRYAKVPFPNPYYFLTIPAKRMLPWHQWTTRRKYHICPDSTVAEDRRDPLTLCSANQHLPLLSHCQPSPAHAPDLSVQLTPNLQYLCDPHAGKRMHETCPFPRGSCVQLCSSMQQQGS